MKWAGDREHVKGAGREIGVKGNQQFHVGGEEAEDRCFPATAEMALVGGEVTQTWGFTVVGRGGTLNTSSSLLPPFPHPFT